MLKLVPITLDEAKRFVARHHRHNKPPLSWKFGLGLSVLNHWTIDDAGHGGPTWGEDWELIGVAIAGRPVGRGLDKPGNIEVTRVCTVEQRNANSRLYGAILRAAAALGYDVAYTYTLQSESGASLKASGWQVDEALDARPSWDTPARRRTQTNMFGEELRPAEAKIRWRYSLTRRAVREATEPQP